MSIGRHFVRLFLLLASYPSDEAIASVLNESPSVTCLLQTEVGWLKWDAVPDEGNLTASIENSPVKQLSNQGKSIKLYNVLHEQSVGIHINRRTELLLGAAVASIMLAISIIVCCLREESAPSSVLTDRNRSVSSPGLLQAQRAAPNAPSILHNGAAFMMMASPGCAVAFYSAMAGFYETQFESQTFFVWMLVALYSMYPIASLAQQWYDAFFDELIGTRVTYSLRVIGLPLLIAITYAVWMSCARSAHAVLIIGCAIGLLTAFATNASFQLVAAMAPGSLVWCEIGNLLGAFLPVLFIHFLRFQPNSSIIVFRLVLLPVVVLCISTSASLLYLHMSGLFDDAYEHLSSDLPSSPKRLPKLPVPFWIWVWCGCSGLMASMSFCILSLSCFFGDASLAQLLSLSKLAAELVGGIVALVVRSKAIEMGPLHKMLFGCVVLRSVIFLSSVSTLGGAHVPRPVFVASVCVFHFLFTVIKPIVQTTLGVFAPPLEQKVVARTNVSVLFNGALIGILIGLVVGNCLP